ncbi:MAG: potassium channel family protein [bacterium]|nr:potassium channel family protein [bacterium]
MDASLSRKTEALARWESAADWPMLVLALGSVPLLVFESAYPSLFAVLNWVISGLFAAELGGRLFVHGQGRTRYAISKWYDFAIVALTLIPVLMPLRALRSVRVLKLLKAFRVAAFAERGFHTVRRMWDGTSGRYVMLAAVALVAASAAGVWLFESDGGGDIDSWGDTIWWTIVTMTTVGYGDISPVTGTGKAAAIVLMLAGITIFGFITANLAAWFTKSKTEAEEHNLAQQVNKLSVAVEKLSGQIEALKAEDEPTS